VVACLTCLPRFERALKAKREPLSAEEEAKLRFRAEDCYGEVNLPPSPDVRYWEVADSVELPPGIGAKMASILAQQEGARRADRVG
jgi:hypothetical protein